MFVGVIGCFVCRREIKLIIEILVLRDGGIIISNWNVFVVEEVEGLRLDVVIMLFLIFNVEIN